MKEQLENLKKVTCKKPFAIGEIGTIPAIAEMKPNEADWLWFMMWSGDFILSEKFTTEEVFRMQYQHSDAVTLDQLPKLF